VVSVDLRSSAQVVPSYARAKLDPLFSVDAADADEQAEGGALLAGGGAGSMGAGANGTVAADVGAGSGAGGGGGESASRRRRVLSLLYRALCLALDTQHVAHLLLFLSGRSCYASLSQRLLRYRLLPAPPSAGSPGLSPPAGASRHETAMWLLELPLQHARQLLLLSAFGYRLLAWLHAPQNAPPLAAPLVPPPPPPPPLAAGKTPPAPGACAECGISPIEQPTASPSGYVRL